MYTFWILKTIVKNYLNNVLKKILKKWVITMTNLKNLLFHLYEMSFCFAGSLPELLALKQRMFWTFLVEQQVLILLNLNKTSETKKFFLLERFDHFRKEQIWEFSRSEATYSKKRGKNRICHFNQEWNDSRATFCQIQASKAISQKIQHLSIPPRKMSAITVEMIQRVIAVL